MMIRSYRRMPGSPSKSIPCPGSYFLHNLPNKVQERGQVRNDATGVGSELALASDMRFASRDKAILPQRDVGAALVPGGGPMARLPRLIGRGRVLEVLLGADDIRGDVAEL